MILKHECELKINGSEITPELLKDWAVDICKSVLEKDESMSSDGQKR